jgi:hypothetical protein
MATFSGGAFPAPLTPRPTKTPDASNYINFTDPAFQQWSQQYLPEIYEKEVERYGKRTVGGFLRMVSAEMPMASDQVIWTEQGRLHLAFKSVASTQTATATEVTLTFGTAAEAALLAVGMTLVVADASNNVAKVRVSTAAAAGAATVKVQVYGAADLSALAATGLSAFVFGSEYAKGSENIGLSRDASFQRFSNKPIILRDKYSVSGSDVAQIGWIEVTSEAGTSGYLWYLKSEHESRLRFEDYLEMAMVEGEKKGASGATTVEGTEGMFEAIETRGMVYTGTDFDGAGGLGEFDALLAQLDKQGAIEENMLFLNRSKSLEIDNMLAAQNSYGAGGTSYGVFDNSEDMALNLGFSGFRRGSYDFYKTDWKYLNDATTRGLIGDIEGALVPAGTSTVYDETLGKNIARPFLHVRYRANEVDDRRMKSWVTGSVGGNYTSDEDAMNVHFLSERALCVQAANNFVLLKTV